MIMETDEQKACRMWCTAILLNHKEDLFLNKPSLSEVKSRLTDIALPQISLAVDSIVAKMIGGN